MKTKYPIRNLVSLNFWLALYIFFFALMISLLSLGMEGWERALFSSIIGALVLALNSYINVSLLLILEKKQRTSKKNPVALYSFFISLSFLIIIPIDMLIVANSLVSREEAEFTTYISFVILCILVNAMVIALQWFVILQDAKINSDIENSRLKAANADAMNKLLRQQVHPHFLFNALNILKSLYKVDMKAGERYLIHLSDFLRAAFTNIDTKVAPLKDELKLCSDYLEMQKIRFGNGLNYSVHIEDDMINKGFLPSFSIQPLLENAIKHNELTQEAPLNIIIRQEGDRIRITNNLKLKNSTETSTGIGLVNLAERYKILADDEIVIDRDHDSFSVSLKILMTK